MQAVGLQLGEASHPWVWPREDKPVSPKPPLSGPRAHPLRPRRFGEARGKQHSDSGAFLNILKAAKEFSLSEFYVLP